MAEESCTYLDKIDRRSELLADSDVVLRIAGFSPFHRDPEFQDDGPAPDISAIRAAMEIEEEIINQYRGHIRLTEPLSRPCAKFSFTSSESSTPTSIAEGKLYVKNGIRSLAAQMNVLNKSGRLDQLIFICSRSSEIDMEPQYV